MKIELNTDIWQPAPNKDKNKRIERLMLAIAIIGTLNIIFTIFKIHIILYLINALCIIAYYLSTKSKDTYDHENKNNEENT